MVAPVRGRCFQNARRVDMIFVLEWSVQLRRRDFMTLVIGGVASTQPLAAQQSRRLPRIGILLPGTPASFSLRTKAFLEGLGAFGYVEDKTIVFDWKWGQDRVDVLPGLAQELVRNNADVILTGGTAAATALKNATPNIPIVMAIIGDPVAAGLVESLARPGGNATGFSIMAPELGGKRLQLLKEILPGITSVAVLLNSKNPQSKIELAEMRGAAQAMTMQLQPAEISSEAGLDDAFRVVKNANVQGLIVLTDPIFFSQRKRIVDLASATRLPAIYFFQEFPEAGGLMSYGPSDTDLFRRAAGYVDRILKGVKPRDLPVQQPTLFDLVVNLKTAKALGLAIPESFLLRADKVIE
jgi:putative tryptophan/tyrosine transport system substrate-binding protein